MGSTHTAGPWIFNSYMDRQYNIRPKAGTGRTGGYAPIAKVSGDVRTIDRDTMLANARLIAAAPDLLAALIECEAMLDEFDANSERTARIRAAIAKAKGE